jgi:hypothetical protein
MKSWPTNLEFPFACENEIGSPVLNCSNRLKDWKPLRPGSVYVRRESSQCWSESLKQFARLKPHKYTRTWPTASCPLTPSTYFNDASMTQGSACQVLALVHKVVSFMMELILEWDATAIPCLATRNDMIWITGLCKEYWARYWQRSSTISQSQNHQIVILSLEQIFQGSAGSSVTVPTKLDINQTLSYRLLSLIWRWFRSSSRLFMKRGGVGVTGDVLH